MGCVRSVLMTLTLHGHARQSTPQSAPSPARRHAGVVSGPSMRYRIRGSSASTPAVRLVRLKPGWHSGCLGRRMEEQHDKPRFTASQGRLSVMRRVRSRSCASRSDVEWPGVVICEASSRRTSRPALRSARAPLNQHHEIRRAHRLPASTETRVCKNAAIRGVTGAKLKRPNVTEVVTLMLDI